MDKNRFLDEEEDAILEGRVTTTEKDLETLMEDNFDDDDDDILDEDDEAEDDPDEAPLWDCEDDIDVDSFDERSRRAKQEEIEANRKLVERLNALEDQVSQGNEEKIAKEYEIAQQRKFIYQQQAEKMADDHKKVLQDIDLAKRIKRDAELKEDKARVFQAEDTLEQLNEVRYNLDIKMREFGKQSPRDFEDDEEHAPNNQQASRKKSSDFDINKLDPDSRSFVKSNPYMNPSSEHYDQGLVDETVAVMEDLKKKYVFGGKKAKVYSSGFYKEVQEAMHNKYSTPGERMRDLVNNPVTGVKRNGDYMKDGRSKTLGVLNNMAKQLVKKSEVRDKQGKLLTNEHKAKLFTILNKKHQTTKAQERGYM